MSCVQVPAGRGRAGNGREARVGRRDRLTGAAGTVQGMSSRSDHASGPAAGRASDSVVERRFRGRIMGVGTTSGVRIVVGMWDRSPFGPFTDVFLELPDGTSVLLAPDEIVAAYVSGTYRFDTVSVVDVRARRTAGWPRAVRRGTAGLDRRRRHLAARPDPAHRPEADRPRPALARGDRPRGTAARAGVRHGGIGGQRSARVLRRDRGARRHRRAGTWAGEPLGDLAPLDPPVAFGFASMPKIPQVVDVETTIREPA